MPNVLKGLSDLAKRLFGIRVVAADGKPLGGGAVVVVVVVVVVKVGSRKKWCRGG